MGYRLIGACTFVKFLRNWSQPTLLHCRYLSRLEASIEEDYLNNLRQSCFREKSYKENLLWQARYSGNNNLLNKAHNYATPSCDQLERLYSY